jgi:cyanophycin synthetase
MKIVNIKVMRGPNVWSNFRRKLIVLKLDIGQLEHFPTNRIEGFAERLETLMPSLHAHRCSADHEGGFFERVRTGTWMGHVVEHVALELQTQAGMETGFGRTRSTHEPGVYNVVFSYEIENAGIYAAKAAVRLVEEMANNAIASKLEDDIEELRRIKRREAFGPSTQSIVDEAEKRNIPYKRIDESSMLVLGYGVHQKLMRATESGSTSSIGVDLVGDKEQTKRMLAKAHIPVPEGELIYSVEDLDDAIQSLGYPLVVKPLDGNHGRGITTEITTWEQAVQAFKNAKQHSSSVIVERFIEGYDYRFLVINYKLVAVAKRTPAMVMGDGLSTIRQLIDEVNSDPKRGEGHDNILTKIMVDEAAENRLSARGYTLDTVLPIGEIFFLKATANLSTGGTAKDVTDLVHPYNKFLAERIARLVNLDICGLDIVAKDIDIPLTKKTGAIVEVNASPGFRMHLAPSKGLPRNVAEPVFDMLFPNHAPCRIPVVAITGTNGKTTTTRLIAHLARNAGRCVGYTTTEGIYIHENMIAEGDCSGPESANTVLRDPMVDFAVLECARGGILRTGLGFDHCDISIVTNVTEDHLGIDGIHTLDDLAAVKAVVPQSTFNHGYSVLNADDDLVYRMKDNLSCRIALFSLHAGNERILEHCRRGGIAAIVEKGWFTICKGEWKTRIAKVEDVPLTFGGKAECMIKNVLPSLLAAYLSNFSMEHICAALKSFIPSPELTPGRMNIFQFRNFTVMVDYAHNEDGFRELYKYMSNVDSPCKIGLVNATGDRRDNDIRKIGNYAAQIFDEIIIKHDHDLRGRTKEELTHLLTEGLHEVRPDSMITVISTEQDAILHAMHHAPKDAFIVVLADHVLEAIDFVKAAQQQEREQQSIQLVPLYKAS